MGGGDVMNIWSSGVVVNINNCLWLSTLSQSKLCNIKCFFTEGFSCYLFDLFDCC